MILDEKILNYKIIIDLFSIATLVYVISPSEVI